jgi:cysteine-rich repeat protein
MRLASGGIAIALALLFACGGDDDGAPPPPADAGRPPDAGPPPPRCGNGIIEAGESCDDGDADDTDLCTAMCRRTPHCGDGVTREGEVCDDGNRASGDGCASDCQSLETCGNGRLDYPAGELCDDGNTADGDGCSADCRAIESCGDGAMAPTETCDDGNVVQWDGCGPDCLVEPTVVLNSLQVSPPEVGCDLNADGVIDDVFSAGLFRLRGVLNAQLASSVRDGTFLTLIAFLGLEDPTADDAMIRTAWMSAFDADADRENNFSGAGTFFVDVCSLIDPLGMPPNRRPRATMGSSIAGGMLAAGPEDLAIRVIVNQLFPIFLQLRGAMVSGRVMRDASGIAGIEMGTFCGAVPMNATSTYPHPVVGIPGGGSAMGCDGREETSFADVMIGGSTILGIRTLPTQPDVDIDGDGLERFEVDSEGPGGCQPAIIACIDGDGTRIESPDCARDPRMADGHSASFDFTAVRATVVDLGMSRLMPGCD